MRHLALAALLLSPVLVNAGVIYEVTVRAVDQTNLAPDSPTAPAPTPVAREYLVEDGKVRAGGAHAKTVFLFEDQTVYVIDNPARTVRVLKRVTLRQVAAHYADVVKQLEEAAASAPPQERAEAQRKAADMREISDRMRQPVVHEYRVTVRSESVDGHACRIWEERERDAKRLEICVAPASALPGGAEILNGMKTLGQFRQGSMVALGVDFGLSEWWPEFATLDGVPLLVREFKFDSLISEVTLTGIRQGVPSASLLNLPDGYQVQDGPDYVQWYMR
ncbi:MAG: hypothetical protein ACLQT5_03725 [Steroidobacteraceae bacterium]